MSIPAMLLLGAAASPHCSLMCGALSLRRLQTPGKLDARKALLLTQAGRIGGYAIAGSLAGKFGQSFVHTMPAPWIGEFVRVLAAIAAVFLGLRMATVATQPIVANCHVPIPRGTANWPEPLRLLIQGGAWALIPCGLLYSVLLMSALSASGVSGALLAAAFALGGSPALALIGWSGLRGGSSPGRRWLAAAWLVALGCASLVVVLLNGHAALPAWCLSHP